MENAMREELRTMVRIGRRRANASRCFRGAQPRAGNLLLRAGAGGAPGPEDRVQGLQDLAGDLDAPDRDAGGPVPVIVGASRHEESVELREPAIPLHRRGVVLRVPDLDAVEPAARPRGDQMVAVERSGMGEDGDTARVAHDGRGFLERDARLGNVRGRVVTEVALERLVEALDVSA